MYVSRRQLTILFCGLLVVSGIVLSVSLHSPRIPMHGGKNLDAWLEQLDDPNSEKRNEAARAILQVGEKAVPRLISLLLDKPQSAQASRKARSGLKALGEKAAAAVPTLAEIVQRHSPQEDIRLQMLHKLGPKAFRDVPLRDLRERTLSKDLKIVEAAIGGLGAAGDDALSPLIAMLNNADSFVRASAAAALNGENFGTQSSAIVPALIQAMSDSESTVRGMCAQSLGSFGARAKQSLPALLKARDDPSEDVRLLVSVAIEDIAPVTQLPSNEGNTEQSPNP